MSGRGAGTDAVQGVLLREGLLLRRGEPFEGVTRPPPAETAPNGCQVATCRARVRRRQSRLLMTPLSANAVEVAAGTVTASAAAVISSMSSTTSRLILISNTPTDVGGSS